MATSVPKQKAGRCVFCNRSGNLTKQHVLPNRLRRIIPRDETSSYNLKINLKVRDQTVVVAPQVRDLKGHLGAHKIRRVCNACNSGWLKRAEEAGFEIITPLIKGENRPLSMSDQAAVALLGATIAAMVDLRDPTTSAISAEEREFIFKNKSPPPSWYLFVGRCNAPSWKVRYRHHGSTAVIKDTVGGHHRPNLHISTVVMGQLLLHAISDPTRVLNLQPLPYANILGIALISPALYQLDWGLLPILDDALTNSVADTLAYSALGRFP